MSACTLTPALADRQEHKHHKDRDNGFSFALIGDTPYNVLPGDTSLPFDKLVKDINSDSDIKWVLHAGDIKSGSNPCSDELFEDRFQRYNTFDKPFIMTIGDNEWTDCHRIKAGEYQPLERLEKLRETFFSQPGTTLGKKTKHVETQANVTGFEEFPENVRWMKDGIIFTTIHIVGSNNGLKAFDPTSAAVRTQTDDNEVARRTAAALAWLDESFKLAQSKNAPGVFIMIHANPGLENGDTNRIGFEAFLDALDKHTATYAKPVVLAHGDSHYFRIDKPALVDSTYLDNFTRVETFGATHVNWIKVNVNSHSKEVFSFSQEITP